MIELTLLCCFAFLAGFIDSIVGGGGLIQVPAMLVLLPDAPVATVFGTNKLAAISGTLVAARQYAQRVQIDWRTVLPAAGAAFVCSFSGAHAVSLIDARVMRPLVLVLLIAVAIYTFIRKDFGSIHAPKLDAGRQTLFAVMTGAGLGFYDGFFGPGTGSFLIFAFVGVFGFDFLIASASSKIVNVATNLAALLYFAGAGHIVYRIALPMAACNVLGSLVGTRLATRKGSGFVRVLFLVVVVCIIVRFAYDIFAK